MWAGGGGGKKPFAPAARASARCHVTGRRNTGAVVWCQCKLSPASLCTNSLFRKWGEEREITDQRRTNSLTSSSCLSTFRTSCVFSSERERGRGRGGLKTREHIDQPTEEQHFMTTDPTPPQQRGRERVSGGGGGREEEERKEAGRKQHTRTHLKIYLHILCTRWANIWCLVVIGVYKALVGFVFFVFLCFTSSFLSCWGAVRHLVPTQREGRCQLCSLARSLKSHSGWLTHCSAAPHPRWLLLLHVYPLKLITTC